MFLSKSILGLTGLLLFLPLSSYAQEIEVRIGVAEFAESILGVGIQVDDGSENSVALSGEVIFGKPEFLSWALQPRPYLNATLNLEGKTSFAGGGLLWRQSLGDRFYGDIALGLVAHNGTNEIRPDSSSPTPFTDIIRRDIEERAFGSTILFRQQVTLGYKLTDTWSADVYFEHISNGGVLGRDDDNDVFGNSNDGADILGARLGYRF